MAYGFVFVLLILTGFTFWVSMIVDCVAHEPSTGNDKVVWIVIIVFTYIVGALIYYFVRRRPRRFAQ
jgi:prolipoprotein diacylglyceryltransferase